MVRRYADRIDVWDSSAPESTADPAAAVTAPVVRTAVVADTDEVADPGGFVWRGRRYVVRRVLARWRERRAWWRDALDPSPDPPTGIAIAARERRVWRVEATAGRLPGVGVYDLARDEGDEPRWHLVRVVD